jgi:DNA-binding transcriptional regulator WhiA
LEEIQTGQKYIAESLPPITNAELKDLQSAQTIEELEEKLNKYIESRAEVAINRERTISDRKAYVKKTMIKASSVLSEVSKLDPRLTGNIKAENWNDIKRDTPIMLNSKKVRKR